MANFKPSTWAQPVQDIVKEYTSYEAREYALEDTPTEPGALSKAMVRRGVLDPLTGAYGGNSKQGCITGNNIKGFSELGKQNYERTFKHA